MSGDDPFDEDRTVIRPMPGGRRPGAGAGQAGAGQVSADATRAPSFGGGAADSDRTVSPRRAGPAVAAADLSQASFNPLVGAATALLGLAMRLKPAIGARRTLCPLRDPG